MPRYSIITTIIIFTTVNGVSPSILSLLESYCVYAQGLIISLWSLRSIIFVVFFHEFFEIFQTFHIISSTNTDSYISSFLILIPATTSC